MLSGIHFLLTYSCNFECEHCFIFSGPQAKGTFTIGQIREVLSELVKLETIEGVCFEGGEPSLYYTLMLEGIRCAHQLGFKAGIVTNGYWAISDEDAELWLKPLIEAGLSNVSISDDELHYGDETSTPPQRAIKAAEKLGTSANVLSTGSPVVEMETGEDGDEGVPTVGGGVMFRGRAVEKLTGELPKKPWEEFVECPHEDLKDPKRCHIDVYGNVHLCQGLSMGNIWETPLSELARNYDADAHPICGPLVNGGPAALARKYGFKPEEGYIDACQLCYLVRRELLDRFPQYLTPKQVYGF